MLEGIRVADTQAVLIKNKNCLTLDKEALLASFLLRVRGVLKAQQSRYIMLHIEQDKLDKLSSILPGCESPTVLKLKDNANKVAVHVVSVEEVFWDTIEKLKEIGASSILVLPIEKMIS